LACILRVFNRACRNLSTLAIDPQGRSVVVIVLDTKTAPAHRRLAIWQDIVCDVFVQLDCTSDIDGAFRGAIAQSMIGPVSCTRVDSCRQRVHRTPSRIAGASEDYILVSLETEGYGGVVQDGREAKARPGEFVLYDTTRPYELVFDGEFSQTIFQVPRALLQQRVGSFNQLTATTFGANHPLERLAFDFLLNISRIIDQLDAETSDRLSGQALDLIAMALRSRQQQAPINQSAHRSALLYRLKSYLQVHLRNPDLGLTDVAASLGISARYANYLMAGEQTSFRRYLLAQRLEHCSRDLRDATQSHRHVGEIAFAWGFNDLGHFSRTFKERYGVSPREWRQEHFGQSRTRIR
jgi:AraC-like DNA-binding protein